MIYTSEFIVEPIDNEDILKFFDNIQRTNSKQTNILDHEEDHEGHLPKKFTSMATNATTFRWKFGDKPGNPIIETTVNPYIHKFKHSGTYQISHQSCYVCPQTGTLTCSTGWCTQTITVIEEGGMGTLATLGLGGLFLAIAKMENCCELRDRYTETIRVCNTISPKDTKNKERCKSVEELYRIRLKECKEKCIRTRHEWKPSSYECHKKNMLDGEICQTIEHKKRKKPEKK